MHIINVEIYFPRSDFPFKIASMRRGRGLIKCIHRPEPGDQNNSSLLLLLTPRSARARGSSDCVRPELMLAPRCQLLSLLFGSVSLAVLTLTGTVSHLCCAAPLSSVSHEGK